MIIQNHVLKWNYQRRKKRTSGDKISIQYEDSLIKKLISIKILEGDIERKISK